MRSERHLRAWAQRNRGRRLTAHEVADDVSGGGSHGPTPKEVSRWLMRHATPVDIDPGYPPNHAKVIVYEV